jgi:hypothetical protein
MFRIHSPWNVCVLFLLSFLIPTASIESARADDADVPSWPRAGAKNDLTAETLPQLHALIRPHDREWRHLRVNWFTDVVAARKAAAAEDKPIVICYTGGAGYNEPLGVC